MSLEDNSENPAPDCNTHYESDSSCVQTDQLDDDQPSLQNGQTDVDPRLSDIGQLSEEGTNFEQSSVNQKIETEKRKVQSFLRILSPGQINSQNTNPVQECLESQQSSDVPSSSENIKIEVKEEELEFTNFDEDVNGDEAEAGENNYIGSQEYFSNLEVKLETEIDIEDDFEVSGNLHDDNFGFGNCDVQVGDAGDHDNKPINATIKYATGRDLNYHDEKIPFGWHRLRTQRKNGKIHRFDVYYSFRSPCGQRRKFRSKVEIQNYLDEIGETMISSSDFEFAAEAIPFFLNPELQMIDANERQKSLVIYLDHCKRTGAVPFATRKKGTLEAKNIILPLPQHDPAHPQQNFIPPKPEHDSVHPQQDFVPPQDLLCPQTQPQTDLLHPQTQHNQMSMRPQHSFMRQQPQLSRGRVKEELNCIVISKSGTNWVYDARVPQGWEKVIEKANEFLPIVRFMENSGGKVLSSPYEVHQYLISIGERRLTADQFDFSPNVSLPPPPSNVTGSPLLASHFLAQPNQAEASPIILVRNSFNSHPVKQEARAHQFSNRQSMFDNPVRPPFTHLPQASMASAVDDGRNSSPSIAENFPNRILTNIFAKNVQSSSTASPLPGTSMSQQKLTDQSSLPDSAMAQQVIECDEEIENVSLFAQKRRAQDEPNEKYRRISVSKTVPVVDPTADDDDDEVQWVDVPHPSEAHRRRGSNSSIQNRHHARKIPIEDFVADRSNFKPQLKSLLSANVKLTIRSSTQVINVFKIYDETLPPCWFKKLDGSNGNFNVSFASPEGWFLNCVNDAMIYLQQNTNSVRTISLKDFDFNPNTTISRNAKILWQSIDNFKASDSLNLYHFNPNFQGTWNIPAFSNFSNTMPSRTQPEVIDLIDDD